MFSFVLIYLEVQITRRTMQVNKNKYSRYCRYSRYNSLLTQKEGINRSKINTVSYYYYISNTVKKYTHI